MKRNNFSYHGLHIAYFNSQMSSFKRHLKTYPLKQAYNSFLFIYFYDKCV